MTCHSRLSRAAVTVACSLSLALPASVRAQEPGGSSELLPERASEHVTKAIRLFNKGEYGNAEEEFKRAAFFAPRWRPLHFNMAVLAEAQGKLGAAIREYKQFQPYATPEEGVLVEQRIFELDDRRRRIAASYRQQIAVGAAALSVGVLTLGAGGALLGMVFLDKEKIADNKDRAAYLMVISGDAAPNQYQAQIDALDSENSRLEARRAKLQTGSYLAIVAGLLITAYSIIPLSKSIKSKRQLEGLALGSTRLKWNGGAGVTLKF